MSEFAKKRVTVIGLAKSGQAAARLLLTEGAKVKISEQSPDAVADENFLRWAGDNGIVIEQLHHRDFIEDSDLLVVSPGVRIDALPVQWARGKGIPVIGEIELAFRVCPCPVIAVTGSNGKTTVTTLIRDILQKNGQRVFLGGNIGTPFADIIGRLDNNSYVVLEMSSFQLETIDRFKPHVAVFLNFSQNHLDRHKDIDEYFSAKKRIFMNQDESDFAILNAGDEKVRQLGDQLRARVHFFNTGSLEEEGIPNPNFRAALKVVRVLGIPAEVCRDVFGHFPGVEHRLEKVRTINGVTFINDSKATTAEAGRWALERVAAPVVMICGGRDKNIDFASLRALVGEKARKMLVIGEAQEKFCDTFQDVVDVERCPDLETAVHRARETAVPGQHVLLSPMCASFDMFKNYEERGRVFKDLVNRLSE